MSDMAGYRKVNYYELCRLCTSSEGTKMHMFREEGRRRSLPSKIQTCLPLTVVETDALPKIICSGCVEKLEGYFEFRQACINAEAMLESYFSSLRLSQDDAPREGKVSVYVKDDGTTGLRDYVSKKKDEGGATKIVSPKMPPVVRISTPSSSSNVVTSQNTTSHMTQMSQTTAAQENMAIPSAIQILTDQDGNRLAQYKVQVQAGVPSLVPAFSPIQMPFQQMKVMHDNTQQTSQDHMQQPQQMVAAVTLTPQTSAELFGFATKDTRFARTLPANLPEVLKMKNISIVDTGGATIEPGMAQIRLDPEQINQLMTGSGLQLSLAQITKVKQEDKEMEASMKMEEHEESIGEEEEGEGNEAVDGLNEAAPGDESALFECDVCGKSFRRKEHLMQHKKSHSGQRPFCCTYCSKAFSRKEHLIRHKLSHSGQKLFPCDVCQKNFSRKDNLHKHKKTHGINGPHVCEVCGKSFVVKHYYALHRLTHEKDGKAEATTTSQTTAPVADGHFSCNVCPKSFTSKSALETHQQRHKNKTAKLQAQQFQLQQQIVTSQAQHTQPTILTSFPINSGITINPHALIAPNMSSANAVVQFGNYVCTTSDLLDHYRRS